MILSEQIVNTSEYAGTIDILTGVDEITPQVEYNDEWHTYKLNGKIIPSVTQLLYTGEYNNVPEDFLEYSRQKGTLIHKEIEEFLKEGKKGFTQEFEEFVRLFTKYYYLFNQIAIFDMKTYSTNSKDKKEKCYKQEVMYGKGVEYLTNVLPEHHYEIWLPHNKSGRIIDLDAFMEGKKVEFK
jgi:hypothetical protein